MLEAVSLIYSPYNHFLICSSFNDTYLSVICSTFLVNFHRSLYMVSIVYSGPSYLVFVGFICISDYRLWNS